jgi:hypothetical protein
MNTYLTRDVDVLRTRALIREGNLARGRGDNIALTLKDWYIGHYSYLNQPCILILDQDKRLHAITDEAGLLAIFGHQIWIVFLRHVGRTSELSILDRPRIDEVVCEGRLSTTPTVYGARISEILNWVP